MSIFSFVFFYFFFNFANKLVLVVPFQNKLEKGRRNSELSIEKVGSK
jgi:hypothetical protein